MEKRRRRKHNAQKGALVVSVEHRPFFDAREAGTKNVGKLEHAVAVVATRLAQQATCRSERRTASDRCETARRTLHGGLRHVGNVSTLVNRADATAQVLEALQYTSDDALFAQADAFHAAASAHAELYVKEGIDPGLLDQLAGEIDALRKAKAALTLARQRFTEATKAIDQGLDEGDEAVTVLEGILVTAPDAPVGTLAAFRQAKRIGPRVVEDNQPAASNAEPTPAAPPPPVPEKVG